MTETWIWDPGQEDDTRSSDGTGARCCTLPHLQKTVDLAPRPVQAGNPTNRVPGNSVVARVSLGQCGGVCDGTQWAAGRALPRSPGSASVPRERLGPPQGDSATKSVLVPHLLGTNHPRRDQPRRPLQRATPAATTTATKTESHDPPPAVSSSPPGPSCRTCHRATPLPRSPRSASVPRRAILRPNSPSYPTSRGPTNPEGAAGSGGSGGEPDHNVRRAEGSRTTRSGERSTAAPVGTGTTQPHTQLGAWGWFWLTP